MGHIAGAAIEEVVTWAKGRRVMGWILAAALAFYMHDQSVRRRFDEVNRRLEAQRLLLCFIVDTTKRSVASACQGVHYNIAQQPGSSPAIASLLLTVVK